MAVDAGAAGRTDASQQTRPAFQVAAQYQRPTGRTAVGGLSFHPLFDVGSASFWRFVWTGAALAYIVGFHIKLAGIRVGLGPKG